MNATMNGGRIKQSTRDSKLNHEVLFVVYSNAVKIIDMTMDLSYWYSCPENQIVQKAVAEQQLS